jgi:hypothetical protein
VGDRGLPDLAAMSSASGTAPKRASLYNSCRDRHCRSVGSGRACLLDGPISGDRFLAYVRQILVPTLNPNDIVVADNLESHKGKAVKTRY